MRVNQFSNDCYLPQHIGSSRACPVFYLQKIWRPHFDGCELLKDAFILHDVGLRLELEVDCTDSTRCSRSFQPRDTCLPSAQLVRVVTCTP